MDGTNGNSTRHRFHYQSESAHLPIDECKFRIGMKNMTSTIMARLGFMLCGASSMCACVYLAGLTEQVSVCTPAERLLSLRPGRRSVADVFGGTVTSRAIRLSSMRRHATVILP